MIWKTDTFNLGLKELPEGWEPIGTFENKVLCRSVVKSSISSIDVIKDKKGRKLSTRALHVLHGAGVKTEYDLMNVSVSELLKRKNCGVKTKEDILYFKEFLNSGGK